MVLEPRLSHSDLPEFCQRGTPSWQKAGKARPAKLGAGSAEPAALIQLCSRLDPDGLPSPDPDGIARPGRLLLLMECLARLLRLQGVHLHRQAQRRLVRHRMGDSQERGELYVVAVHQQAGPLRRRVSSGSRY